MPEWPDELMAGLDAPRPLSSALRARIEQVLSAQGGEDPSPRPLDEALSARLEDVLADTGADTLAAALASAEQPRPLRPAARHRMERALGVRRRRRVPGGAAAAGVIVLAGLGIGLGLSATGGGPSPSGRAALSAPGPNTTVTAVAAPPTTETNPTAGSQAATSAPAALPPQASGTANAASASAPAAPDVASVDPGSGPSAGGNWVTVTGFDLVGTTAVYFGATSAPFEVLSGSQLRALAPAHASGPVDVRVTTAGGTSSPVVADRYTYQ